MMKKTSMILLAAALLLTLCACGNEPKSGTAVISDEFMDPEAVGSSAAIDLEGLTPADTMPAYSSYYAYDKDGNELYHEIYWYDEFGAEADSDVTEPPEGAVVSYADYTELDEDGNEIWSEHINY